MTLSGRGIPGFVVLVLAGALACGTSLAGGGEGATKMAQAPKHDPAGRTRFDYEKVTERDGRKFWIVRSGTAVYRIPDDYVATITPDTVSILAHWPTMLGAQDASLRGRVHGWDSVIVYLVPRVPPLRDSYEVGTARGHVELRPSTQFPDLLQVYRDSKPTPNFISGPGGPRTPSGNPYSFNAPLKDEPHALCCDTTIALREGNSVRVRFYNKHFADWNRIYPEVLRLIDSFKKG